MVKFSPFFFSFPNFVYLLENTGADGIVLFNRFYQPDIDIENLEVLPSLKLSTSEELRLRPIRVAAATVKKFPYKLQNAQTGQKCILCSGTPMNIHASRFSSH